MSTTTMPQSPIGPQDRFPVETQLCQRGHAFYDGLGNVPTLEWDDDTMEFADLTPVLDRIVHAHYFVDGCDWWITDFASDGIAYGWVSMGNDPEWGPFDLAELEQLSVSMDFGPLGTGEVVVERNLHWTPAVAREVLAKRGLGVLRCPRAD